MTIPSPPAAASGAVSSSSGSTLIDLGDTVPLTFAATDSAGNPVNCSGMALTITQPDGTTVTPSVPNPPQTTGDYQASFVPTQVGRHQLRWVGTGPATAYTDVFYVMAASPVFLISLAEARAALAKRPGQSSSQFTDDELRFYVAAVTPLVQSIAGADLVASKAWTADGGRAAVVLPEIPVQITSVTENAAAMTEGTDFSVDYAAGIVYRGNEISPYPFAPGRDNIVVTYTTGAGIVSENIRLAARIILAHLWQADQQGYRPALGGAPSGDTVTVPGGFAIPRRAAELLTPAEDLGGFA